MAKTNGALARRHESWVDGFVASTSNLETPEIFRRWAAITAIGAVLEQKVWLETSSVLYPNLYTLLVAHPGVGKTRSIRASRGYLLELPEFHVAPTSLTAASLVDALSEAKRFKPRLPEEPLDYNSMLIAADEIGAFMDKWDTEKIPLLSALYDCDVYAQQRRGRELKIKIKHPQLSLLCGTTPSNLFKLIPEGAWDQGFMSRVFLVFSDERIMSANVFDNPTIGLDPDLLADMKVIYDLTGKFVATQAYQEAVINWRRDGQKPVPTHPKLTHYNTRRLAHAFKLSMISSADRDNSLLLTRADFDRALSWLIEVEELMPEIFKAGGISEDSRVMDEVVHMVRINDTGSGVSHARITRFTGERVPAHTVSRIVETLINGHRIIQIGHDKRTGVPFFKAASDQG